MMDTKTQQDSPKRWGRFEPWPTAIVLFFVVVFIVNAAFVIVGQQSWSGLVTEGAYVKGLAFNRVLEAQQQQERLGWKLSLDSAKMVVGQSGPLSLSLRDRDDQPLAAAQIQGVLFRPVQAGTDYPFTMQEEQPGLYSVALKVPLPGQWDVKLAIVAPAGEYRYVQRIHLPLPHSGEQNAIR
ncbi:MAG: FixH family protein [Magnetococcales bacterium]|nr:FixH family protein [Magnetococcales bacterium]